MPYAIATSLHFGNFGLEHLDLALIQSDRLHALMSCVSMQSGPMWDDRGLRAAAPEGASVTIRVRGGRVLQGFRAGARGCAVDPLTQDEIDGKFMACAKPVMGEGPSRDLLERLGRLDGDLSTRLLL